MRALLFSTLLLITGFASADRNPQLALSPWPIFHQNSQADAATALAVLPGAGPIRAEFEDSAPGGTSPWTVLGARYSDGSQPVYGSTRKGVVKHLIQDGNLRQVGFTRLDRKSLDFDWNLAVLRTGEVLTVSRKTNALVLLKDEKPGCAECPLVISRRIPLDAAGTMTQQFNVSHDGFVMMLMEGNQIAAVSLREGRVVATLALGLADQEVAFHNAFPIDAGGRLYLASQRNVTAVDWDGVALKLAWQVPYDFRGPGCKPKRRTSRFREIMAVARGRTCTGTGTTPTLLGDREDGLVVMVDGHQPSNNVVAFWRGEIPESWAGLPGQPRRFAGALALPLSTPVGEGFTAENSPAVSGNRIFVAQWAGFDPDCSPPRGVQRVDWLPEERRLSLVWANPLAHFNGVPTVSEGSGVVLGSGRGAGCSYRYSALDLEDGEVLWSRSLGKDDRYLDQGNQQTVAADGSILYATRKGLARLSRP